MAQLGAMIIGGVTVPITSVELTGGRIVFVTECRGPFRAATGYVTIIGADGRPIGQAPSDAELPEVGPDQVLVYRATLRMDMMTGGNLTMRT